MTVGGKFMIEEKDPKDTDLAAVRCEKCDRMMEHYNTFVMPTNERRNICWECLARDEKGFFAHREFRRGSRVGYVPR